MTCSIFITVSRNTDKWLSAVPVGTAKGRASAGTDHSPVSQCGTTARFMKGMASIMKIDESCINHNAVRLIDELTDGSWDVLDSAHPENERGIMLMTIGEVRGVLMMAEAMKEVLKC